jgi:predicted nucleic acid-binding protein
LCRRRTCGSTGGRCGGCEGFDGRTDADKGVAALERFLSLGITKIISDGTHGLALEIAGRLAPATAHDAHCLAVAHVDGCALWAADRRMPDVGRSVGVDAILVG